MGKTKTKTKVIGKDVDNYDGIDHHDDSEEEIVSGDEDSSVEEEEELPAIKLLNAKKKLFKKNRGETTSSKIKLLYRYE